MPLQVTTSGDLENTSNIVISETRYTMEHLSPCKALLEKFTIGKGQKSITYPKVGQMTASHLTQGIAITGSQDIGMTTQELTSSEAGMRVILTKDLVEQQNEDIFRVIGKQTGDAMSRLAEEDIIALFSALNGGTTFGAAGLELTAVRMGAYISSMETARAPKPWAVVHHPHAVFNLTSSLALIPSATYPLPRGYAEDLVKDFWAVSLDGVPVFRTGNITVDSSEDAIGAIFSKQAMCYVERHAPQTEKEYDIDLRAYKVVITSHYGVYETNDGYGFPLTHDAAVATTT